jgi:hypothetical protein
VGPRFDFFDPVEQALLEESLALVDRGAPEMSRQLAALLERLQVLADTISKSAPIERPYAFGSRPVRTAETLLESLCSEPEFALDMHVPTKVILGQAYLVAKINFLKALTYAAEDAGGSTALQERLRFEVGQSIYSKLAEDLLVAILTDPSGERPVQIAAGRVLLEVWEDPLLAEVDDYAPFLEGAWRARATVRPVLGTMLGAAELHQFLAATCEDQLSAHFESDAATAEEMQAFEEFLFGLSFEDIQRLRAHLLERGAAVISVSDAREHLGLAPLAPADPNDPAAGAEAMYISYQRRRLNARHRASTGSVGPRKTAEEYVMLGILRRRVARGQG